MYLCNCTNCIACSLKQNQLPALPRMENCTYLIISQCHFNRNSSQARLRNCKTIMIDCSKRHLVILVRIIYPKIHFESELSGKIITSRVINLKIVLCFQLLILCINTHYPTLAKFMTLTLFWNHDVHEERDIYSQWLHHAII